MPVTHLQRQRAHAPGKHQRSGQRADRRGYPDDGVPWGTHGWESGAGPGTPPASGPATSATAGVPGTWLPVGSTPPATVAALQGGTPNAVTANPSTPWTAGQHVQTATAGAAGRATWTGSSWVGGVAPGLDLAAVLSGTIDEVKDHVDGLAMNADRPTIIQFLLDYERTHANRSTLVTWLDQQTGAT